MSTLPGMARRLLSAVLAVAIAGVAVVPAASHSPATTGLASDEIHYTSQHGHAHHAEEDVSANRMGHIRLAIDHDHSPAMTVAPVEGGNIMPPAKAWHAMPTWPAPAPVFRAKRPPRA